MLTEIYTLLRFSGNKEYPVYLFVTLEAYQNHVIVNI